MFIYSVYCLLPIGRYFYLYFVIYISIDIYLYIYRDIYIWACIYFWVEHEFENKYLVKVMLYSFQIVILHKCHNGRRWGYDFKEDINQMRNLMFSNLGTLLPLRFLFYFRIVYLLKCHPHSCDLGPPSKQGPF